MPSVRAESSPPATAAADYSPGSLWGYARQIFCVLLFFGLGIVFSPLSALAGWLAKLPPSAGQRGNAWIFGVWLRCAIRLGVFEIEWPPAEKVAALRRTIIAPNHPSLVDAVLLLSVLPRTVCIMRSGLMKSPFLGGAARLAGYVTNDSGPALIRQGVAKLAAGENLLIFPEGTRTREAAVNPFRHGFALIAAKSGAPIQTIFIEREGRYLSKGVSLFAFGRPPFRFRLHFGDVFHARAGERPQDLAARLEAYFRDHLVHSGENIRLRGPLVS